jgi:hypothetical protein
MMITSLIVFFLPHFTSSISFIGEEIDYCTAYIDPEKLREKQAQETMEQVFF